MIALPGGMKQKFCPKQGSSSKYMAPLLTSVPYKFGNQCCQETVHVIFRDESGQNLNLVKPTHYDGRSHIKSG